MSQRPASYTSAQKYKEAMINLEGSPDVEMSITQKRSSLIEGTSSQKQPKGKSIPKLKRPPFWLGF